MSGPLYLPKRHNITGTEGVTSDKLWAVRGINQTGGSSGHELYVPGGTLPDPLILVVKGFYAAPPRTALTYSDKLAPLNYAKTGFLAEDPDNVEWGDEEWDAKTGEGIPTSGLTASLSVSAKHPDASLADIAISDLLNWGKGIKITRVRATGDWAAEEGSYPPGGYPLCITLSGDSRHLPTGDLYDTGVGETVKCFGTSSVDYTFTLAPLYGLKYLTVSSMQNTAGCWDSFYLDYSYVNMSDGETAVVTETPTGYDYFEGKPNYLVTWQIGENGLYEFDFQKPDPGMIVYSEEDSGYYQYDSNIPGWIPLSMGWPEGYDSYCRSYWRFENNMSDSQPPGSLTADTWILMEGSAVSYQTGKRGNSVLLPGDGCYGIAVVPDINPTDSIIISVWVKPYETVSDFINDFIIACPSITAGWPFTYSLCFTGGAYGVNQPYLNIKTISSTLSVGASTTMEQFVWYHLVGIVDRTASKIYLYLDGVENEGMGSLGTDAMEEGFGAVQLGGVFGGLAGAHFHGEIDELSIWQNVTFSTAADRRGFVRDLYNNGIGDFYI